MCLSLIALLGDSYLGLVLKAHYSIDLFGGLIIGDYIWLISNNYLCYYIDVKLFGLTLHERFGNELRTKCQKCKIGINNWVQKEEILEMMIMKKEDKKEASQRTT